MEHLLAGGDAKLPFENAEIPAGIMSPSATMFFQSPQASLPGYYDRPDWFLDYLAKWLSNRLGKELGKELGKRLEAT